jgi:O-succinylbenzoate synthase
VELLRVAMVLRAPVVTAYGVEHARDVALVRVVTDDGEGWGECAALPEPTYSPEYVAGALHVLEHHLVPRLLGTVAHEAAVARALAPVVGHPMAKAAVEMAVLDARLRAIGRPLAAELGATDARVVAGRTVGIHTDLGSLRAEVDEAVTAGYREPLSAVRADHPHLGLGADANGSYDPAELLDHAGSTGFDALAELGLTVLEQPFPAGSPGALLVRLAAMTRVPVALDEDVSTVADGVLAVEAGWAAAVVAKPGRLGGLWAARSLGRAVGGRAWVGGMYETGLGRAANLALAACDAGFAFPVDWSASDRYWEVDLTEPHALAADGTLAVPGGPGLGVSPDPTRLTAWTRHRWPSGR